MARTTAIDFGRTGVRYRNYQRKIKMDDLIKFSHERQRFIMIDTRPPANAFEWKRFVVEEAARRGDKVAPDAGETSRKRSTASSKAIERNRLGVVQQGNIAGMSKDQLDAALTPKKFHIYNQPLNKANKK